MNEKVTRLAVLQLVLCALYACGEEVSRQAPDDPASLLEQVGNGGHVDSDFCLLVQLVCGRRSFARSAECAQLDAICNGQGPGETPDAAVPGETPDAAVPGETPDAAVPGDQDAGSLPPPSCAPDCSGKQCGDDGCGGSCGDCSSGQSCDAVGKCSAPPPDPGGTLPEDLFFDDFLYSSATDSNLTGFGWEARAGGGGPGEGTWSPSRVTFVNGPTNKVLRLTATLSQGSAVQAELDYTKTRMLEGTYAGRVFYTDTPDSGRPGAIIVEAGFWTMSDWGSTSGTNNYSEEDFEYLPSGGWGQSGPAMFNTSWYNDTNGISTDTVTPGSFAGWHTVMLVVSQGQVKFYDAGKLLATHGGQYYPRSPMNIIPQLWFFQHNVDSSWHIDIDWLFYAQSTVLTAAEVEAHVNTLRSLGVARQDTVK